MDKTIWVVAAKRTPIGSFQGLLKDFTAPQLGKVAIQSALQDLSSDGAQTLDMIQEVFMGCVLTAGCGQAPARQAAIGAELPYSVGCSTINKVCGSGMKSVMLAHDLIQSGRIKGALAGGMESMTNAPYLLKEARSGLRIGHKTTFDHLFLDGLQDAYSSELMGVYADNIAEKYDISRNDMDQWAQLSLNRALEAQRNQQFANEIAPVAGASISGPDKKLDSKTVDLDFDEHPREINPNKIPRLRPAFSTHGRVTAANASSISDGAAALVLMEAEHAKQHDLQSLAKIVGHTTHARQPSEFTVAPVYAIGQLLEELQWTADDVDLWEINEAFAVVTQIAVQQLKLDVEKVNVNGGACALGHPIGASGARIIVTLIHALRHKQTSELHGREDKSQGVTRTMRGIAALCIGGGEATAIAIEIEGA